jgi:hypothetical protein
MDFVEGFPKVGGKLVVFTVVDRFSKFANFLALSHPYSAASVAKALFVFMDFPVQSSVIEIQFLLVHSGRNFFILLGVKLHMSSAFHPQSDEQSKVVDRVILMYLRCLASDRPKTWLNWLAWVEYCYKTSYQIAIRCSPFQVVYGREPPALIAYQPDLAGDKQLQFRDEFLREIKAGLVQAQVTMKNVQNKTRRDVECALNDWVLVRLLQRTAVGITTTSHSKLGPKFYGSFKVLQCIGSLPPKARIHDVFHVTLLKNFEGDPPTSVVPLPAIYHSRVLPTTEKALKARMNSGVWEVLIQWTDRSAANTSWE